MFKYFIAALFVVSSALASNQQPELDDLKDGMQSLSTFLSSEQGVNQGGQDVHSFNRKLAPHANFLRQANAALGYTSDLGATDILDHLDILRLSYNLDDSFEVEVNKLKGYLNQNQDYDGETTMSASELLSSLWGYINASDDGKKFNAVSLIFFYLQQNTIESGGCFPGYVGRLMTANATLLIEE